MSQIILEPDQLKIFARRLSEEVSNLRQRTATLEGNRQTLEGVWKDHRYDEFEKAYDPAMRSLQQFCREAEEYAAHLVRKADLANRYLRR